MQSPEPNRLKTAVIVGSLAAVVIGVAVVGLLVYRARALPSPGQTGQPPGGQPPNGTAPGGTGSATTTGQNPSGGSSTSTSPVAPPDYGIAPPKLGPDQTTPDYSECPDADKDGLTDCEEAYAYHTDPHKADTDGDGYTDYAEINSSYGSDPLDPKSVPAPQTKGTQNP